MSFGSIRKIQNHRKFTLTNLLTRVDLSDSCKRGRDRRKTPTHQRENRAREKLYTDWLFIADLRQICSSKAQVVRLNANLVISFHTQVTPIWHVGFED